jgi:hypothetical protein
VAIILCFNDLSADQADASEAVVNESMRNFVLTLLAVRKVRPQSALITPYRLPGIQLTSTYSMAQWASDARNMDLWRRVRSFQNRAPYTYDEVVATEVFASADYRYDSREAKGLGVAHMLSTYSVSIPGDTRWSNTSLNLQRFLLTDDEDESVLEDEIVVDHVSHVDHVKFHRMQLSGMGLTGLTSGREIWAQRDDFFPNLSFLPRVEQDLASLAPGWVASVRDLLAELESAVAAWEPASQPFPEWKKVTPEGEKRKQLCYFEDLDGVVRLFDLHARFAPEPGRLHLRLVREKGTARVAYIGRKLGA